MEVLGADPAARGREGAAGSRGHRPQARGRRPDRDRRGGGGGVCHLGPAASIRRRPSGSPGPTGAGTPRRAAVAPAPVPRRQCRRAADVAPRLRPREHDARFAALERDAFAKGYAQGERAGVEAGSRRGDADAAPPRRDARRARRAARRRCSARPNGRWCSSRSRWPSAIVHREIAADRRAARWRWRASRSIASATRARRRSVCIPTTHAPSAPAEAWSWASGARPVVADPRVDARRLPGRVRRSASSTRRIDAQFQELRAGAARGDGAGASTALEARTPWLTLRPRPLSRHRPAHSTRCRSCGRVVRTVGLVVESNGPRASVGELCDCCSATACRRCRWRSSGSATARLLTVPLGGTAGIRPGDRARGARHAWPRRRSATGCSAASSTASAGRSTAWARSGATVEYPLQPPPINPLAREPIAAPLGTGVRAIDALLTCGRGQRIGLFGGSGVGKSTLLGMMARGTAADVIVIALVGERGREVRSFLEHDLGPEGLERSVVVVSTSDSPPLVRLRAAYAATAIAEYFRDQGKHVLLMMDSVTRFAMAQREVGLAAGEPPTAKGYPPSVFAMLPGLLERAGNLRAGGGITGVLHRARRGRRSQRADRRRACAPFSTATSCCRAISAPAITIRRSTSCRASAGRCRT